MRRNISIFQLTMITFLILIGLDYVSIYGQDVHQNKLQPQETSERIIQATVIDSLITDSIGNKDLVADSIAKSNQLAMKNLSEPIDTLQLAFQQDSLQKNTYTTLKHFIPDAKKATWYAIIFPGGGQIYNRKYWKLPIVYGGFVGCAYALNWNNNMYKDYKQAYIDIMDDDPNTKSYEDFLPQNIDITGQELQYQERFRKRKDAFRRQRDLSIFAFIGVYILTIIDAYVDAELSDFDISNDLGFKIEPTLINNGYSKTSHSIGLQCSIKF